MDVVPNLLNMVGAAAASEAQKVAGLQAVGYITDDITKIVCFRCSTRSCSVLYCDLACHRTALLVTHA